MGFDIIEINLVSSLSELIIKSKNSLKKVVQFGMLFLKTKIDQDTPRYTKTD